MQLYWILIIGFALILSAGFFLLLLRGEEDTWLKDERGVWVMHGNSAITPDYVKQQQDAVSCADNLYQNAKNNNIQFSSQCLGVCKNYSIDIVNVPRNSDDEKSENQCQDYKDKTTKYFIELNKNGEIVRIV